jgi:hypothetical protein
MADVDLTKLLKAASGGDAISVLTTELGGRNVPFRKIRDFESGLSSIAEELHTEYVLSYTPNQDSPGHHSIRVEVNRAGASVRARPGYIIAP